MSESGGGCYLHLERARALTLGRKKAEKKKSSSVSLLQGGQLRGALGPLPKLRQPLPPPRSASKNAHTTRVDPGWARLAPNPVLASSPLAREVGVCMCEAARPRRREAERARGPAPGPP